MIYIVVLGSEGSGKSVTIDALAHWFKQFYKGSKRRYEHLIWTAATARDIDYLYKRIPEGKKFIFMGIEDSTGLESDLFDAKRRRWICQNQTGERAGVLVQVLGLHDWFGVHKLLRDSSNLVIAKSSKVKLDTHAAGHQKLFMSGAGVRFTQDCEKKRNFIKNRPSKGAVKNAMAKYGHHFGYGTIWEKVTEKVDLWYNPDIELSLDKVYDLQYRRQGEEEINSFETYEIKKYSWGVFDIFHWEEPILQELQNSEFESYAKFFKAKYIDLLKPNRKETWDVLGLGKTQIYQHYNQLENGQSRIGGFISEIRGKLFEQFILAACEHLGIKSKLGPTISQDGFDYQDDLLLMENIIINAKCGRGLRQYTREKKVSESGKKTKGHYKTTYVFAQNDYDTYILYYDLETNLITLIDKNSIMGSDKINVGGKRTDFPQIPLSQALERICRITPLSLSPFPDEKSFCSVCGLGEEKHDEEKCLVLQKEVAEKNSKKKRAGVRR